METPKLTDVQGCHTGCGRIDSFILHPQAWARHRGPGEPAAAPRPNSGRTCAVLCRAVKGQVPLRGLAWGRSHGVNQCQGSYIKKSFDHSTDAKEECENAEACSLPRFSADAALGGVTWLRPQSHGLSAGDRGPFTHHPLSHVQMSPLWSLRFKRGYRERWMNQNEHNVPKPVWSKCDPT